MDARLWRAALRARPEAYGAAFALLVLAGVAFASLGLAAARATGRLPAPPFTGSACIDEKLRFMRGAEFESATLVAVGSSATWRNLDFEGLESSAFRPFNAAPCYLYVSQTVTWARFVLSLTPQARELLVVLHPRDFETCVPEDDRFFDEAAARNYVTGRTSGALLYFTNMRLGAFAENMVRQRWLVERGELTYDRFGSGILDEPTSFFPPLRLDGRCFAALDDLAAMAQERKVRLIVALMPLQARWRAAFDPSGRDIDAYREIVRQHLEGRARLVDLSEAPYQDAEFADPVHLYRPGARRFTRTILATTGA